VFARDARGLSIQETTAHTGWKPTEILDLVRRIPEITAIGDILIPNAALDPLRNQLHSTLDGFHKRNPLVPGMSKEELRGHFPDIRQEVFERLLVEDLQVRKIELTGDLVRLAGRGVVMKDEEAESKNIIESAFASAGLKVPALKDVLAGLRVDKMRAQKIVTLLLRDRTLVKVSEDLVFHRSALEDLRRRLGMEKARSAKLDVGRFKDLTGVTRKYAIPLLEYLDRERVTRRMGDAREIL
jgi:selenocysteine-specific elongation factor